MRFDFESKYFIIIFLALAGVISLVYFLTKNLSVKYTTYLTRADYDNYYESLKQ